MSVADWKRIGDAERDERQLKDGTERVLRIEVRVENAEDTAAVLSETADVVRTLLRRGEHGVYECQWCSSAARISIARLP